MLPYQPKTEVTGCNNEIASATSSQIRTPEARPHFSNAKELLDFCMKNGENSNFISDPSRLERLNWLKDVWTNLSVDLVAKLKECLQTLHTFSENHQLTDEELERVETSFSEIEMICEDMDFANDFLKVGAGPIISAYLFSSHHELRFAACNLIATLSQHNEYAQNEIIEKYQLMPVLFDILVKDPNGSVRLKSLYAISALTRENKSGVLEFVKHDGFAKLATAIHEQTMTLTGSMDRDALTSTAEKLILKSTFLLNNVINSEALTIRAAPDYSALCRQLAETYRYFVTSPIPISTSATSDKEEATVLSVRESIADCLLALAKRGGRAAVLSLRENALEFETTLEKRIQQLRATHVADTEEPSREELQYVTELRALINDAVLLRSDALACV